MSFLDASLAVLLNATKYVRTSLILFLGLGLFDIFLFNAIMFIICCYCEGMEPLLLYISWHALSLLRERCARKRVSFCLSITGTDVTSEENISNSF